MQHQSVRTWLYVETLGSRRVEGQQHQLLSMLSPTLLLKGQRGAENTEDMSKAPDNSMI